MFQSLVVFKGGLSRRYKVLLAEKEKIGEEYNENKASLFRVVGTSPRNMQAIQVNLVATSLNSSYSYILQYGASAFTWIGKLSSDSDHEVLDRMLYFLDTSCQPIYIREGNETDTFWNLLGGKSEYPKEKEMRKQIEEPHLFTCSCSSDVLKVKEIYNFVQDDLTTEDVFLLDCQSEVYVWIGSNSNIKSKEEALTLGLKFLEMDILEEGLTMRTPVYVVTEGHEPPFFTRFFEWVPEKANMHGNSFERKLASLKGKKTSTKRSSGSQYRSQSKDNASRDLQSRSVSSNGSERGVSPCSSEKLLSLSSAEDMTNSSNSTPVVKKLFSESLLVDPNDGVARQESSSKSDISKQKPRVGINSDLSSLESLAYSYEQLRVDSQKPVTDIDATRREAYLTEKEFEERFGMAKSEFYALPKWKQNKLKISLHLF
jgi:hypothetical protein